jgi:hypothetical protein
MWPSAAVRSPCKAHARGGKDCRASPAGRVRKQVALSPPGQRSGAITSVRAGTTSPRALSAQLIRIAGRMGETSGATAPFAHDRRV